MNQGQMRGCTRYTVVFHLNGQRVPRTFGFLQKMPRPKRSLLRNRLGHFACHSRTPLVQPSFMHLQKRLQPR